MSISLNVSCTARVIPPLSHQRLSLKFPICLIILDKEALSIVLACAVWGEEWDKKKIHVYCDNEAAVISLNSGSSKDTWTMHLIRCLFFIKAKFGLIITISHIPGKGNKLADALSRNDFAYFCTQFPAAQRAIQHPSTAGERLGVHPTGLDVGQLGVIFQQLFSADQ